MAVSDEELRHDVVKEAFEELSVKMASKQRT